MIIVLVILALTRRIRDTEVGAPSGLDVVGVVLSAAGLGLALFFTRMLPTVPAGSGTART